MKKLQEKAKEAVFQSTLLQEERRESYQKSIDSIIFQSTLLQEERQYDGNRTPWSFPISIHAPTRGATAKMHNYPYTYL